MDINIIDHGGVKVAEINGDLSLHTVEQFRKEIYEKVRNTRLVLNLGSVQYIDSMGLATLMELTKMRKTHGVTLHLANVSKKLRSLFDLIAPKKSFDIYQDVHTAVTSLKQQK